MKQSLRAFCVACSLLTAAVASAQSNLVLFISSPGDYIGQGQTYVTTNQANFSFSGSASLIQVGAFGFNFSIEGPGGATLVVGLYTNSARYPFNGSQPGLDVSGNGRGCNADCGSFQIKEIHVNSSGQVDHFWAVFTNRCECSDAPMYGDIRFNSQLAPAAPGSITVYVPADYPTIQAAITAASPLANETVVVSPGVYNESVNFEGRTVLLISAKGPSQTFISPPAGQSALTFSSGETSNAIVSGFTITNGGIGVSSSSPTIVSNIISYPGGSGISGSSASPIIIDNVIRGCGGDAVYLQAAGNTLIEGNVIETNGAGIDMFAAGSVSIINNLIQGNGPDAIGGVNDSDANIIGNVIAYNAGSAMNFLVPDGSRGPVAVNNTIIGNKYGVSISGYDGASEVVNNILIGSNVVNISYFNSPTVPVFENNDIFSFSGNPYSGVLTNLTGTNGNISINPSFTCLPTGDFRLLAGSACIDAGTNGAPDLPSTDFDGNPRIVAGTANGPAIVDMGAFEFNPAFPPSPCLYLDVPFNIVAFATAGQDSAVVNYPAPTGTPGATITSVPPSGSVFPAGTNIVTCTLTYGVSSLTNTFTVTVLVPPYVTNQPSIVSALANSNVSLTVSALGTLPITYQWSFGGVALGGATNSTLTLSNVQAPDEGYYEVTLKNVAGVGTSAPIVLRILPAAASIASGPFNVTVSAGQQAVLRATVLGSAPLSLQWYKDGELLLGANSTQLSIPNAQATDMGSYQLSVSNSLGSAVSTGATLTVVDAAPTFALMPASMSAVAGSSATFRSVAIGTDTELNPIRYSWYFQNTNLTGQTSSNLTLLPVTAADQGAYFVVAANSLGSATSMVAQLTVDLPPSIQSGLSNEIVNSIDTVVLNPNATGTPSLFYTWFVNGVQLSNTAPTLTLSNVQPSQTGYYSVLVTNQYGRSSSTCRVSVFNPPSTVIAWGDDSGGQTGVPTNLDDAVTAVGGDFHTVALHDDGSLIAWGYDGNGQTDVPTNSGPYVAVAAGADHNLAITEKGSVVAWGLNTSEQCTVPASVTSALAVAAGDAHSVALLESGTVIAWGDNTYGESTVPPGLSHVTAIAAGRTHNLALLGQGTVVAWGDNGFGQSAVPAGMSNVVAIAAGYLHSAVLLSNGVVVVWGDNTYGQTNVPPGLSNVVAIAAGDFHTLALRSDGSVVGWGDDTYGQTNVPSTVINPVELASGYYHGLALVPIHPLLIPALTPQGLVIQWSGTGILQSAPSIMGPFTDISGPCQSYTNCNMGASEMFFRLRR